MFVQNSLSRLIPAGCTKAELNGTSPDPGQPPIPVPISSPVAAEEPQYVDNRTVLLTAKLVIRKERSDRHGKPLRRGADSVDLVAGAEGSTPRARSSL